MSALPVHYCILPYCLLLSRKGKELCGSVQKVVTEFLIYYDHYCLLLYRYACIIVPCIAKNGGMMRVLWHY